jgi:hypothetical protein
MRNHHKLILSAVLTSESQLWQQIPLAAAAKTLSLDLWTSWLGCYSCCSSLVHAEAAADHKVHKAITQQQFIGKTV